METVFMRHTPIPTQKQGNVLLTNAFHSRENGLFSSFQNNLLDSRPCGPKSYGFMNPV